MTPFQLRSLLVAGAAALILSGCGPGPEQLAAEQRVHDLRDQLRTAKSRAAKAHSRATNLRSELIELDAERESLASQLVSLNDQLTGSRAEATGRAKQLDGLLERFHERAVSAGVHLSPQTTAGEALAALQVHDSERAQRQNDAIAKFVRLTNEVAKTSTRNTSLTEEVKRLTEERQALQDGWTAQTKRTRELNAALTETDRSAADIRAELDHYQEDNLALARANVMLRQETAAAHAATSQPARPAPSQVAALTHARDQLTTKLVSAEAEVAAAHKAMADQRKMRGQLESDHDDAIRATRDDLNSVSNQAAKLASQVAGLTAVRDRLESELEKERATRTTGGEARGSPEHVQQALAQTLDAVKQANELANERAKGREANLREAQLVTSQLRARVDLSADRVVTLEREVEALNTLRRALEAKLVGANDDAQAQQARFEKRNAELGKALEQASKKHSALQAKLEEAGLALAEANLKGAQLAGEQTLVTAALDRIARELADVRAERDALRGKPKTGG
jgi:chromosome segregation ATPase